MTTREEIRLLRAQLTQPADEIEEEVRKVSAVNLAERLLDAIEEAERTLNPTNPRGSFLTDEEQKRSAWESLVRALEGKDERI